MKRFDLVNNGYTNYVVLATFGNWVWLQRTNDPRATGDGPLTLSAKQLTPGHLKIKRRENAA